MDRSETIGLLTSMGVTRTQRVPQRSTLEKATSTCRWMTERPQSASMDPARFDRVCAWIALDTTVNSHVGRRLAARRSERRMAAHELAHSMNVEVDSVLGWENGTIRISPPELCELCRILDVDICYFFSEMPANSNNRPSF